MRFLVVVICMAFWPFTAPIWMLWLVSLWVFDTLRKIYQRWLAHRPITLAFIVFVAAAVAVIVGMSALKVKSDELWEGVLIEAVGLVFDLLVIVWFLEWLKSVGDKQRDIRHYREEIEDYLHWKSDIARHRLQRLILRLNKLGVTDIYLEGAYLEEAYLRKAQLRKANLSSAKLHKADLNGADLTCAKFCKADLSKAELWQANLSGTNLKGANLRGAKLSTAFNLTQDQLNEIGYDDDTELPVGLYKPKYNLVWSDGFD